ncbi:Ribosomal protein S12 methylthiotransferase RimO [Chitinispirillum alkaliphilum]|nr:Ribosomal protein S12 methylthiotransferase RimO [Chitinispirillum alkaliphilum]
MIKVALQNLGCSKNLVDGEKILHFLTSNGLEFTEDLTQAEIITVNTCAFIKEAQEEAIGTILDMAQYKNNGRCEKLIVCGCFSERYREKVRQELPEVDIWAGVQDWQNVLKEVVSAKNISTSFERRLFEPVSTQHLKIAEGCSHRCSFCVIPSIRGDYKSRTQQDILAEANWLYQKGTRELILVAQDTSRYGFDRNDSLVNLLQTLLSETDFPWIRMMYLHPQFVTDELLQLVASDKRICPYFDIPLQHIADPVLRGMDRRPLSDGIYKLINRIRSFVPDAGIRSSFILGFPGETEDHYKELRDFIEFARFEKLGVFPFSAEEGTKACDMRPRPGNNTVARRCEELMAVQREISREILESRVGSETEIIIDRVSDDPDFNFEARTRLDAPEVDGKVYLNFGSFEPGTILKTRIIGASDYDLYAQEI